MKYIYRIGSYVAAFNLGMFTAVTFNKDFVVQPINGL